MNFRKILLSFSALVALTIPAFAQNEIKPGKAVQISIKGVPATEQAKIDGQYSVTENGLISMPYLSGPIRAAGMTPGDLAATIQSRYRSEGIYRTPTVQVFSSAEGAGVDKQTVTVGGFVRRPGPIEFTQELTLYKAIQAAGGATEFGSLKRVMLYRNGVSKRYDANKPQFMNIKILPSDSIDVPQKDMFGN